MSSPNLAPGGEHSALPTLAGSDPKAHLAALCDGLPGQAARDTLMKAYHIAARAHSGQFRKSEADTDTAPYLLHPLRVAGLLAEEWERRELKTLVTALLHDVLEDCPREQRRAYEQEIIREAGIEVFHAVEILTKPMPGPMEVKASRDARYFGELRKAPVWVRMVKLADRVDNLRDALAWGNVDFWMRYSSETIGWHLFLARETAPIAEVALFKALVEGERALRGRAPVWADGYLIDPSAACLIPEHVARAHNIIGMALQGETLIVGILDKNNPNGLQAAQMAIGTAARSIHPIQITRDAIQDALAAGLYGAVAV